MDHAAGQRFKCMVTGCGGNRATRTYSLVTLIEHMAYHLKDYGLTEHFEYKCESCKECYFTSKLFMVRHKMQFPSHLIIQWKPVRLEHVLSDEKLLKAVNKMTDDMLRRRFECTGLAAISFQSARRQRDRSPSPRSVRSYSPGTPAFRSRASSRASSVASSRGGTPERSSLYRDRVVVHPDFSNDYANATPARLDNQVNNNYQNDLGNRGMSSYSNQSRYDQMNNGYDRSRRDSVDTYGRRTPGPRDEAYSNNRGRPFDYGSRRDSSMTHGNNYTRRFGDDRERSSFGGDRDNDGGFRGSRGGRGGRGGGRGGCFNCGQEGHFSRECTESSRGGFRGRGRGRGGYNNNYNRNDDTRSPNRQVNARWSRSKSPQGNTRDRSFSRSRSRSGSPQNNGKKRAASPANEVASKKARGRSYSRSPEHSP